MVSVLSCATFTAEDDIPSPSAAMRASDVSDPVRSTVPTMTVIVPSFSRRQAAAAGSVPPGQTPAASPVPIFQPLSSPGAVFCSMRFAHRGCSCAFCRHSSKPMRDHVRWSTVGSPSLKPFFKRKASGSSSNIWHSSSTVDSRAKQACGEPGAR